MNRRLAVAEDALFQVPDLLGCAGFGEDVPDDLELGRGAGGVGAKGAGDVLGPLG